MTLSLLSDAAAAAVAVAVAAAVAVAVAVAVAAIPLSLNAGMVVALSSPPFIFVFFRDLRGSKQGFDREYRRTIVTVVKKLLFFQETTKSQKYTVINKCRNAFSFPSYSLCLQQQAKNQSFIAHVLRISARLIDAMLEHEYEYENMRI